MAAIDDYLSIGTLLFDIAQGSGEPLAMRVTSSLEYEVEVPRLALVWRFTKARDCLAFLQSLDGDPTAQQEAVKQAKIDELNERIQQDTAEIESLGGTVLDGLLNLKL